MKKLTPILLIVALFLLSSCSQSTDGSSSQSEEITVEESEQVIENEDPSISDTEAESTEKTVVPGNYITLAQYESAKDDYSQTDVVLFFNANWCSTCKLIRDDIQENLGSIPSNLTIVLVDFDTEIELRKMYGVVIQHTFVQINTSGKELAKWSGSITVKAIAEKII